MKMKPTRLEVVGGYCTTLVACQMLGVSQSQMEYLIMKMDVPLYLVGHTRMYWLEDIEAIKRVRESVNPTR